MSSFGGLRINHKFNGQQLVLHHAEMDLSLAPKLACNRRVRKRPWSIVTGRPVLMPEEDDETSPVCMKDTAKDWPERLAPESPDREAAVAELRVLLLKGLRSGLTGRPGADEAFLEDVTQTALIRILDHLGSFERRSAFSSWVFAIALRVALSELRREHWKNVSLDDLNEKGASPLVEAEPSPGPDEQAARNSLFALMQHLIRTELTPLQRDVLMAELRSMPQEEIARRLGTNRNAIYKAGHDARKALKRALEAAGYHAKDIREVFADRTTEGIPWR